MRLSDDERAHLAGHQPSPVDRVAYLPAPACCELVLLGDTPALVL